MIPYEELVAALDLYVARNGGTPQSTRARAPSLEPPRPLAPPALEPPTSEIALPSFDEPHDPDLPSFGAHGDEDATYVGASPGGGRPLPPPLSPVGEDRSNEIDIGDVLTDDDS
jgi:hypothetical protein